MITLENIEVTLYQEEKSTSVDPLLDLTIKNKLSVT